MTADFRRFLSTGPVEQVLAYFGGPYVADGDRRLSVRSALEPGFYRFAVTGRRAEPLGPAEPPDLTDRPAERGYVIARTDDAVYLATESGAARRLAIGPADEPLPFAPVRARRYPRGELVFDTWEFESGVEDAVREAYDRRQTLASVRGAPAALRAAFGYAVLLRVAAESSVPARPAEARPHLAALADRGDPAAREVLGLLRRERERARPEQTPQWILAREEARRRQLGPLASDDPSVRRAAEALYAARAALRGLRRLEGGYLEARYDLDGERFVSIVDSATLNVVDAGICLDGSDRQLTLESLPSVIREAMQTGRLHVTAY